ncbi:MAG TPA: hypothetical protein VN876_04380 [Gemmatimonadaceae bacterium]|nr:hypothetical protein [Gemmatimonadaceae bacterium]
MTDSNRDKKRDIPTDSDELAAEAAVNEGGKAKKEDPPDETVDPHAKPNPPRTTSGKFFTAPKFGSAGSGGLEIEPGLDSD